jgi:hypothetical protein
MPTFEEIEKELKAAGALSQNGQKGLTLTRTPGGAILRNVNKAGEPIRFNKAQIAYLTARFPELTDVLTRNMETMRRVQGLRSRLTNFLGVSGVPAAAKSMDAKSLGLTDAEKTFLDKLPERQFSYFESLDSDPNRKLPANLAEIKASSPETLPRAFTRVDMTDPKKPIRTIFQIEFDVGGFRTDEAVISYVVSSEEMNELSKGKSFAKDIRGIKAKDLKVFYFDVNKRLTGSALLAHHTKTLNTLKATATRFLTSFDIKVVGKLTFASKEVYLDSVHANLEGLQSGKPTKASLGRQASGAGEAIEKATTAIVTMEPIMQGGVPIDFKPTFEARGMKGLQALSPQQVDDFVRHLGRIGDELLVIVRNAAK